MEENQKTYEQATPEERRIYHQRLMDAINRPGSFNEVNGIMVTKTEENYCEGELTITSETMNPQGGVHGGALFTLADTITGIAAATTGKRVVTLNASYSYIRAGSGSKIRCIANLVAKGTGASLFTATLLDDQGRMVGRGSFSFFYIGNRYPE